MRISDNERRAWYTEECAKSGWSVRQLERQINTLFYERLLSSKNKAAVEAEIQTTEPAPEYEKIITIPVAIPLHTAVIAEITKNYPNNHLSHGKRYWCFLILQYNV